jgi:hypothetical protein
MDGLVDVPWRSASRRAEALRHVEPLPVGLKPCATSRGSAVHG